MKKFRITYQETINHIYDVDAQDGALAEAMSDMIYYRNADSVVLQKRAEQYVKHIESEAAGNDMIEISEIIPKVNIVVKNIKEDDKLQRFLDENGYKWEVKNDD